MNRNELLEELKQLTSKLEKQKEEKVKLYSETTETRDKINSVRNLLRTNKSGEIIITDHAIVRYMERIKHLDVEQVKKLIVPEASRKTIERFRSGMFPVGTHVVVVKNGFVKTVLFKDMRNKPFNFK